MTKFSKTMLVFALISLSGNSVVMGKNQAVNKKEIKDVIDRQKIDDGSLPRTEKPGEDADKTEDLRKSNYDEAAEEAEEKKKLILVQFSQDRNSACTYLENNVFGKSEEFQKALVESFVLLKLEQQTKYDPKQQECEEVKNVRKLIEECRIKTMPSIVILDPKTGVVLAKVDVGAGKNDKINYQTKANDAVKAIFEARDLALKNQETLPGWLNTLKDEKSECAARMEAARNIMKSTENFAEVYLDELSENLCKIDTKNESGLRGEVLLKDVEDNLNSRFPTHKEVINDIDVFFKEADGNIEDALKLTLTAYKAYSYYRLQDLENALKFFKEAGEAKIFGSVEAKIYIPSIEQAMQQKKGKGGNPPRVPQKPNNQIRKIPSKAAHGIDENS